MKNIKIVLSLFALIAVSGLMAQTANTQVVNEVFLKKYTITDGEQTITYALKINSKEKSTVKMKTADLNKAEQDRIKDTKRITKLIRIDSDSDNRYDNVLELSYESKKDDNFSIKETTHGFIIEVTGKKLDYDFLKKDYSITSKDKDTFEVVVLKYK